MFNVCFVGCFRQFLQGKKCGAGEMVWRSRDKYVGDWGGNKMHGSGTYSASDGSEYSGDWFMHGRTFLVIAQHNYT